MSDNTDKKPSVWQILNRWLYDGSKDSKMPVELETDKSIGQMNLLYYFRCSPYGLVISKLMNNWGLFSLDRVEVLYFLKECVYLSGYKPPFIQKIPGKKNKLYEHLKEKYPYLKLEEINMLVGFVDESEEKDTIYEMFGIYSPKKKKITESSKKKTEKTKTAVTEELSLDNLLGNFE
jgi:hypothetical protein